MAETNDQGPPKEPEIVTLAQFYESIPPGRAVIVSDVAEYADAVLYLKQPDITLYCGTKDLCEGLRRYKCTARCSARTGWRKEFVTYMCRNCWASSKTFAVEYNVTRNGESVTFDAAIQKYGEFPNFGPPTAARLTRLLGNDKELFLKGRSAENQGMGIAAFAYYRRVIENQKDAIFDEIIRVSKGISASTEIIAGLQQAKKQVQFTNAVEEVRDGIPPALLINGHNPLTLMHAALSEGLHAQSDEQCLALATDLRVVMADFVDRMAQAMKDNAELHSAVSRLLNRKQPKLESSTEQTAPGDNN